ncbi:hypothetical protein CSIM01_13035 [Colletotrichum simmondsii]|uniref:Uncharacterized protein n=1 Tax=Colletotrichum simmondsii TaxID=703756 RepID=A0A135TKL1_9PEZI|nr:hypothetical protein CSIM01_13035 [Colletotrichum simmondsii]
MRLKDRLSQQQASGDLRSKDQDDGVGQIRSDNVEIRRYYTEHQTRYVWCSVGGDLELNDKGLAWLPRRTTPSTP